MMDKEKMDSSWSNFLELCCSMKDPEKLDSFFSLFLTYEERETIASRYLIVKALLESALTQREMAEAYKVSIAQITRGSNALKIIDPDFRKFLEKKMQIE